MAGSDLNKVTSSSLIQFAGGIAGFTAVDGSKVESRDLGNNFLLTEADLGQSKAQAVSSLLKELNDSVAGGFVEADPEQLIEDKPEFFKGFALIVATQVQHDSHACMHSACNMSSCRASLHLVPACAGSS